MKWPPMAWLLMSTTNPCLECKSLRLFRLMHGDVDRLLCIRLEDEVQVQEVSVQITEVKKEIQKTDMP